MPSTHSTPLAARRTSARTFRWSLRIVPDTPPPARPALDGSNDCMTSCGVAQLPSQRAERRRTDR